MSVKQKSLRLATILFGIVLIITSTGCNQSAEEPVDLPILATQTENSSTIEELRKEGRTAEPEGEMKEMIREMKLDDNKGDAATEVAADTSNSKQEKAVQQAPKAQVEPKDGPKAAANQSSKSSTGQANSTIDEKPQLTSKSESKDVAPTKAEPKTEASSTPVAKSNPASEKSVQTPKKSQTKEQPASNDPAQLTFDGLYSSATVRGMTFSDKVESLNGKKVVMSGYMAPPLTAEVSFFVLTKIPLAVCPFCSTDADWPADIMVVYMPKGKSIEPTEYPVRVTGTLSIGSSTDDLTGFVSLLRIQADKVEVLKK